MMSANDEDEQKRLKIAAFELTAFLAIFEKYGHITHELIEKIIVPEADKFSKNTKVFHKARIIAQKNITYTV